VPNFLGHPVYVTVAGASTSVAFRFTASRNQYVLHDWSTTDSLFWKKAPSSDNVVIRVVAGINKCKINTILSKYHIVSTNGSTST